MGEPRTGTARTARTAGVVVALVLLVAACTGAGGGGEARPGAPGAGSSDPSVSAPSSSAAAVTPDASPSVPQPTTAPAAEPPPAPAPAGPQFAVTVSAIGPELAARMTPSSWRPGCPVALADLRHLSLTHRTFDGGVATGELVVHADVVDGVVGVFRSLFDAGYPIRSLRLVDDFGGSDDASMAADNTSAFNCRAITRGTGWSEHAYGRALDLNPVENPYVRGDLVLPPEGQPYASRPDLPGVVRAGDVVVTAFASAGWLWGGDWDSPVDYQHFSVTGR